MKNKIILILILIHVAQVVEKKLRFSQNVFCLSKASTGAHGKSFHLPAHKCTMTTQFSPITESAPRAAFLSG